jgi:hypothetical protein
VADTPEQARVRASLRARGNQLAPRVGSPGAKSAPSASTALNQRKERATRRRTVVLGAVEGSEAGPAGAAVGAAKAARSSRVSASSRSSPTTARRARSYAGGRAKGFTLKKLNSPQSGALFAEYFGGALVICLDLFVEAPSAGYATTMSKVMIRLTALTAVFFVLFLMTGSKRGGQAAVWMGLLIDLGIIFTAARAQTFSTTADEIAGKGSGVTTDAATSALTPPVVPPGVTFASE